MKAFGSVGARGRWAGRLGVCLLGALAVGCGGGQTARVSGQVLYKGKPVTGGLVTFVPADSTKRLVPAQLDANGRYDVDLPLGEVAIAVDNSALQETPRPPTGAPPIDLGIKLPPVANPPGEAKENPAAPKRPPGIYVPIPPRYYDVQTSGLTFTVRSGSQPFDIELK